MNTVFIITATVADFTTTIMIIIIIIIKLSFTSFGSRMATSGGTVWQVSSGP